MTAAMAERVQMSHDEPWDTLLETWRGLDVPEGWHAEIGEGQIHVVPPPHRHHNHIAMEVLDALYEGKPRDLGVHQTLGLHIPALDRLCIPDLVVVPRELTAAKDTNAPVDAGEALLVVEITSRGNAEVDRVKKLAAYAQAGIPTYLLIDRFDPHSPSSTLFTEPRGGVYLLTRRVPFGEQLQLPKPFNVKIDTSAFPV
ncbi:Uma2 family endonuclease [Streptomyces qinzhouensis]|uniref:Uma2 family endonuclease n=1 Tax=Streptomyces qinzhouensis TaxID=2599401 RepID=A0A5B8IFT3_9ACTN|nr:Uma2 family endonuclease [Streptomyces qinzhouensis]QDY77458.1 Uma2 family endonuclease [Streptomyces qinzhouensis]